MSPGRHRPSGMRDATNARHRATERRQTFVLLTVLILALIAIGGSCAIFNAA